MLFDDSKLASFLAKGFDEELAKNLWELSEKLVKVNESAEGAKSKDSNETTTDAAHVEE